MEKLKEDHHFSANALKDMELVQRALKQNDQKAYGELMKRYNNLVYYMLLGLMNNNKNDAEDLTMETFEKAFKHLDQFTSHCAFSTWLFKIAANNAIDFIRHNKAQESTLSLDKPFENTGEEELSIFVKGTELNPEESIIRKQNIYNIRSIIEELKPNYREIAELFYLEEFSNEEIANHLGLSLTAVRTRLSRARDFIIAIVKHHENF